VNSATFEAAVCAALDAESQQRGKRLRTALMWAAGGIAVLWFTAAQIGMSALALLKGIPFMADFFSRMFPPDLSHLLLLGGVTLETVQIAVWGTSIAIVLSVPFALLGARNTTPHPLVFYATRLFLNALRSINELVFALIFVSAVGLGPFAGVLAIALHATGMLAKFCAEEVEGVDRGPIEAMQATGAGRLQVILFGIVPQVIPAFVSYSIYRFDVSIRAATILGLVGAGGLGFSLIKTMKLFKYHETATCILVIFVIVFISDWICARIRARII
jgi:phosphonate transport system permease protein